MNFSRLLLLHNGQYHVEDVFDHDTLCLDATNSIT